jgi:shikimate kinase
VTVVESFLAALVSAIISGAGTAFLGNMKLNARVAAVELKVAEKYVAKEDLYVSMAKFEEHLIRIENKFDQLLLNTNGKEGNRG